MGKQYTYVELSDPGYMKFSYILEQSPPRLEDNDASKCSSNYFHTQNMCHHVRNSVKITLQYFIVLQSQGVKVKSEEKNNGVNLSHSFPRFLDLLPTIREQKNIKV